MFIWLANLGTELLARLLVGLFALTVLIGSAYEVDESLILSWWMERKRLQVIHEQTTESATTVSEQMLRLGEITAVPDETDAPDTCAAASTPTLNSADVAEITVDLEPLYAELEKLSPDAQMVSQERQAFICRVARIRSECFCHPISEALTQRLETGVRQIVKQVIEEALVQELNEWLGFEPYERTGEAKRPEQHRSGSYTRSLRTSWGWVDELHVPKLRRGNEKRVWRVLKRYERSFGPWLDLQLYLYTVGASQSNLQEILALSFGQVLSVKAIEHLTDVAQKEMDAFRSAPITDTPSVILVDGVNLKVMCPAGIYRTNRRGHRRAVKMRQERVLLAALGVWPDGSYRVLYFELVDKETKANWRTFFRHLLDKELDVEQLELVVSDGRPGLHTAICSVFKDNVKHQRCIFHKLKNLGDNLEFADLILDATLPHKEAVKQAKQTRAQAILNDAAAIYDGSDLETIRQRKVDFVQKWQHIEPKAVRRFGNDFDLTLNYLRVPFSHKNLIRTTNLLERFFREFRARADEIGCFGSQAQAETLFYLILRREKAKRAIVA
jgi:transposase-like protein